MAPFAEKRLRASRYIARCPVAKLRPLGAAEIARNSGAGGFLGRPPSAFYDFKLSGDPPSFF